MLWLESVLRVELDLDPDLELDVDEFRLLEDVEDLREEEVDPLERLELDRLDPVERRELVEEDAFRVLLLRLLEEPLLLPDFLTATEHP